MHACGWVCVCMRGRVGSMHVDLLEGLGDWTQPSRSSGAVCCSVIDGIGRRLRDGEAELGGFGLVQSWCLMTGSSTDANSNPWTRSADFYRPTTIESCYFQPSHVL